MERDYEELYAVAEESHPWFTARREIFSWFAGGDRAVRILDVGCGTGIFLSHLKAIGFTDLAGVEISTSLRAKFRDPSIDLFAEFPDRRFEKVFMLDVLEHIEDDRQVLREIYNLLEPGGSYYLSVPAHPFLWSHHDEFNMHKRRYRKDELKRKLHEAGFVLKKLSYWNTFLFPAVCAARWWGAGREVTDLRVGSGFVLWLYGRLLKIENWIVKRSVLPVGVSLIAVAQKPLSLSVCSRGAV